MRKFSFVAIVTFVLCLLYLINKSDQVQAELLLLDLPRSIHPDSFITQVSFLFAILLALATSCIALLRNASPKVSIGRYEYLVLLLLLFSMSGGPLNPLQSIGLVFTQITLILMLTLAIKSKAVPNWISIILVALTTPLLLHFGQDYLHSVSYTFHSWEQPNLWAYALVPILMTWWIIDLATQGKLRFNNKDSLHLFILCSLLVWVGSTLRSDHFFEHLATWASIHSPVIILAFVSQYRQFIDRASHIGSIPLLVIAAISINMGLNWQSLIFVSLAFAVSPYLAMPRSPRWALPCLCLIIFMGYTLSEKPTGNLKNLQEEYMMLNRYAQTKGWNNISPTAPLRFLKPWEEDSENSEWIVDMTPTINHSVQSPWREILSKRRYLSSKPVRSTNHLWLGKAQHSVTKVKLIQSFKNDFSNPKKHWTFEPSKLTDEEFITAPYAHISNRFSSTFELDLTRISDLTSDEGIEVMTLATTKSVFDTQEMRYILVVEKDGEIQEWKNKTPKKLRTVNKDWWHTGAIFKLSQEEVAKGDVLKIYIWTPEDERPFLQDDFEIIVLRTQN